MKPFEARRRVATMLCCDPPISGMTGESSLKFVAHGVSEMTEKSFNKLGRRPGAPLHPTRAAPIGDRYEIASADSFPASDAPGWTAVTGSGAPRIRGGFLSNEERSS